MILLIKSLNEKWSNLIKDKNKEGKYFCVIGNKNIALPKRNILLSQEGFEALNLYTDRKLKNNISLLDVFVKNYNQFYKIFSRQFLNHNNIDHKNFEYLYMNYIRQAYSLLLDYNIKKIIIPRMPHRLVDYSIFIVASYLKIKIYYFDTLDQFYENNIDYFAVFPILIRKS